MEKIAEHKGKIFGDWAKKQVFINAVVRVAMRRFCWGRYGKGVSGEAARTEDATRKADWSGWQIAGLDYGASGADVMGRLQVHILYG
jgi:hypothetical protein